MPGVSSIDDAYGISVHHTFILNCVVQVVRVWSLPDPAPTPEVPIPFGTAQPSHGCVRDTDQLVELPLIDITDAAAQKDPVVN